MFGFCFFILSNILLISALVWLCIIIIRVLISPEYRKFPPFLPSFRKEKRVIIQEVRKILKSSKKQLTVLDPGCGTGTLLLKISKEFPEHKFVGIEWNKFIAKICSIRAWRRGNLQVIYDDIFNHNFGDADIVVCFLIKDLMKQIGEKLLKDNKKPQIVFSNAFEIPNLRLYKEITTSRGLLFKNVYIYKL